MGIDIQNKDHHSLDHPSEDLSQKIQMAEQAFQKSTFDKSEQEALASLRELLLENATLEYDQKFAPIRKSLESLGDPKLLEMEDERRETFISNRTDLELEKMKNEKLKKNIKELSFDSLMGLKQRRFFYTELNDLVKAGFAENTGMNVEDWDKMSFDEFAQMLKDLDSQKLSNMNLSVMMGDVAFLSQANKKSHQKGDELLKKIGGIAQTKIDESEDSLRFFRHGGDEITGIIKGSKENSSERALDFKRSVESADPIDYFKELGLPLNIDVGTADFNEAMDVFKELTARLQEEGVEIAKGRRLKAFVDLWLDIADRRSMFLKAQASIKRLKNFRQNNPSVYEFIANTQRKGALDITDQQLDRMIQDGEDFNEDEFIREYIFSKLQEKEVQSIKKKEEEFQQEQTIEKTRRAVVDSVAFKDF